MKVALLLVGVALLSAGQDTVSYTNQDLNLAFTHPKDWIVRTTGVESNIIVVKQGSEAAGVLDVKSVYYFQDKERWQETQRDLAKYSKMEVEKQWEEDMLGVPVLLTQTKWTEEEIAKTRVSGLVYSATRKKLLFMITAETKYFGEVETQVRTALQSLKTIDGSLPKAEDPTREKSTAELKAMDVKNAPLVMKSPSAADQKALRGPVVVPTKTGGLDVNLHLPEGWSATQISEGVFSLKHPKMHTDLAVSALSTLNSDPAEKAFIKASGASLAEFIQVKTRVDRRFPFSKAGAKVLTGVRSGTGTGGPLFGYEATGETGYFYWLLKGKWTNEADFRADSKLVDLLVQGMSLEPAK